MWSRLVLRSVLRSVGDLGKHQPAPISAFYLGTRRLVSKGTVEDRIYTSEQRDVVIDKLNSIRTDQHVRKLLGARLTTNIETHLHRNGNFNKLEELLQVQSVGPKTIRTVCDKLLGISPEVTVQPATKAHGRRNKSFTHLVSPPLSEATRLAAKILLSVTIDVNFISWALVDSKTKNLLDWQTVEIHDEVTTLQDVILKAAELEKSLPRADLYILEDPTAGNANSRSSHNMKSHLTCSLATSLHNRRDSEGAVQFAFVKNRLVEKHFQATVGSETISLQPFIADIMEQKVVVGRSNIFISQELAGYMKSLEPHLREHLSRAGLLAVSCIDLILASSDMATSQASRNS